MTVIDSWSREVLDKHSELASEAYSEHCQTSKLERIAKIVNG